MLKPVETPVNGVTQVLMGLIQVGILGQTALLQHLKNIGDTGTDPPPQDRAKQTGDK